MGDMWICHAVVNELVEKYNLAYDRTAVTKRAPKGPGGAMGGMGMMGAMMGAPF